MTLLRQLSVAGLLVSAAVAVTAVDPRPAQAGSAGWVVTCPLSHSAGDDPIVKPGKPGATHRHDFLGNRSTGAHSTSESMDGAATTCRSPADRAGYWAPAVVRDGKAIAPAGSTGGRATRQQVYYRANNLAAGTKIEPFPADMRIVAGNAAARSASENPQLGREIYWGCSDNSTGKLVAPPRSCASGIVTLHVGFPNCWDGLLTHVDDTAHLRYPSRGLCPSGFSRALPRMIQRYEYPVGTTTGAIALSSGATHTAHADFWNTWDQTALARLVAECLGAGRDCGKDPA